MHHYNLILKNKDFPSSGRVRINLGNIYFKQKKYYQAIKMQVLVLCQSTCGTRDISLQAHIGHLL
jgi:intraflagellar transport protein 88